MKNKKHTAQSAFFNLRALVGLLVCGAAASSMLSGVLPGFFRSEAPTNSSQRTLTLAERIAYQRAIEEIYWRHRIWPKERPDAKPSLDAVMSQAQLATKVADYLRNSQALEDYWHRPISAEQLQAEMDRMATHTRQPEVLRELFETLGNDPFVIAECLARQILTQRLITELNNRDRRNTTAVAFLKEPLRLWATRAEAQVPVTLAAVTAKYTLPVIGSPLGVCTDDTWTPTSTTSAPGGRSDHAAVWTGSEMIVWGGYDGTNYFNTGGRYSPSTDSWTATSTSNAPSAREDHTAVWTGSEMIVWGGYGPVGGYSNTGGRYNPATNSWTATSLTNAPGGRYQHAAVWTGTQMIVWGGVNDTTYLNTGGRYTPDTDSWTPTSTTNAPSGRSAPAVWTGSEMIVWGGFAGGYFNTGGRYNPSTDSWAATSITNAPNARYAHTAVWTGNEMIVWGGTDGATAFSTGGKYNPGTNAWTPTSITNAPSGRQLHTAVWSGSQMIVWGGNDYFLDYFNTGGRYYPGLDIWIATGTTGAPVGRSIHSAVWAGFEMIVWGGHDYFGDYFNTGGRYCARSGSPTPTPTATASPTPTSTATASPTPTPTASPTPTPTPPETMVLYDQYNNAGNYATLSATFTDSPPNNSDLADDFVVPGGQTWNVQSIDAEGGYFTGSGPANSFNVLFYVDSGGFPGTQVYAATNGSFTQSGTTFTVNLPTPAVLAAGTYWVEIQANMTFSTEGEWGWADRMITSYNAAVWRNPGGGFGLCPSWSRRGATCNIDASEPDQIYRLSGTIGGATPTPTASPTPTATPTPTPTPTPCTGRCAPTPRPNPTSPVRPTPPPHLTPPPTASPNVTPAPRPTPPPRP